MKLSDIPKPKIEFDVPEQYFNTMQNSVLQRIAEQEKQKIIIRKRIFTISAIAASFIIIMGIGFIFLNDFTSSETHDQLAYSVVNKAQKVEKKIISDTGKAYSENSEEEKEKVKKWYSEINSEYFSD